MRRELALLVSLGAHAGVFTLLSVTSPFAPPPAAERLPISLEPLPERPAPPPAPPREAAAPAVEPAPPPVDPHPPRSAKRQPAAAGRRPEHVEPDVAAAPLPPAQGEPGEVVLPSPDAGAGAGGTAASGDGAQGGEEDGEGSDLTRPPIPLEATKHTQVPYTRDAIAAKVSGVALVEVLVNEEGRVTEARLKKPIGHGLDPLALTTARTFRFQPAQDKEGRPVAQWIVWEFKFAPAQ